MSGNEWIFVIEENKVPEQARRLVFAKGLPILLIRKSGNEFYAIANRCAHMGCPLDKGSLDGYTLTCPCHAWKFDIRTGSFLDAPEIKIPVFQWKADNGKMFVDYKESA